MKKCRLFALLCIISLSFLGCNNNSSDVSNSNTYSNSSKNSENNITTTLKTNSDKYEAAALNVTSIENFQILSANCETNTGSFNIDQSFCIQTDYCSSPILVTAHHLFGPKGGLTNQLTGEEITSFVTGGTISDAFNKTISKASIDKVIPITDAMPIPYINRDVAAFILKDATDIKTFKLAQNTCKTGEIIYLLANIEGTSNDTGIYKCICSCEDNGVIYFTFSDDNDISEYTSSISGAPIVNSNFEVLGIYIASTEQNGVSVYAANSTLNFSALIEAGYERMQNQEQ